MQRRALQAIAANRSPESYVAGATLLHRDDESHVAYTQADVDRLSLREPLLITEMKTAWLTARDEAHHLVGSLPAKDVGCLYLDASNRTVAPDASDPSFAGLTRHYGTVRGAWPVVG